MILLRNQTLSIVRRKPKNALIKPLGANLCVVHWLWPVIAIIVIVDTVNNPYHTHASTEASLTVLIKPPMLLLYGKTKIFFF